MPADRDLPAVVVPTEDDGLSAQAGSTISGVCCGSDQPDGSLKTV